jgi:hypothetical protein
MLYRDSISNSYRFCCTEPIGLQNSRHRIRAVYDNSLRVLFYVDDMKLFLPGSGFQDCLKIQSDLHKLSEWCDRNSLILNVAVGKCKTFAWSRHPVEFSYMLGGTVLDQVSSINDLGAIMTFSERVDVMVAKAFAILGFIRRLSLEYREPYTLKSLYTSLVRLKLCVEPVLQCSCWQSGTRAEAIYSICFAWSGLDGHTWFATIWGQMPLLHLDTLTKRRSIACVIFIFDVLSVREHSPNLMFVLNLIASRYPTRSTEFLRIDFHRTMGFMNQCRVWCDSLMRSVWFRSDPGSVLNRLRLTL